MSRAAQTRLCTAFQKLEAACFIYVVAICAPFALTVSFLLHLGITHLVRSCCLLFVRRNDEHIIESSLSGKRALQVDYVIGFL